MSEHPISRRLALQVIAAALPLAGCSQSTGGKKKVGLAFETLQTQYWQASYNLFRQELEKRGFEVLEAIANGDASRQQDQVASFLTRGVVGIIVAPKDAETAVPLVKKANRANVPIAFYNRPPAENAGTYTAIQADNQSISRATVQRMAEVARERGGKYQALILLGDLNDMNAIGRRDGFLEAIAEHEDIISLEGKVASEWNQEKAMSGVTAALSANPEINFIFSSSDFLFPSVISALKAVGKYHKKDHEDHVILGGFDGDPTAYQMLVDGYLDADGVQDLYFECEESVKAIVEANPQAKAPVLIRDDGFVIHQGNLDVAKDRMWGANIDSLS